MEASLEQQTHDAIRTMAVELDTKMPSWHDHVNPDTLDMGDTELCIAGQLDYWTTNLLFECPTSGALIWWVWADADEWCAIARKAWRQEIAIRRLAALIHKREKALLDAVVAA